MSGKRVLEKRLEELRHLGQASATPETSGILAKALADKSNLVVAQAAKAIAALRVQSLVPDLIAAFERLLQDGAASDPQCRAKLAIINTLKSIEHADSAIFLRGMSHIQWEPVWGGQEDTAAQLRGTCALALVQCRGLTRERILQHLVDAFTDRAESVRADAARALEQIEGHEPALLLRFKARIGDAKSRVTGQVLESLLNLEGAEAIPFIKEFLNSGESEVSEEAALVLAASRLPQALSALTHAWSEHRNRPNADFFLRAIALSRLPEAAAFLENLIQNGVEREAKAAKKAIEASNR